MGFKGARRGTNFAGQEAGAEAARVSQHTHTHTHTHIHTHTHTHTHIHTHTHTHTHNVIFDDVETFFASESAKVGFEELSGEIKGNRSWKKGTEQ